MYFKHLVQFSIEKKYFNTNLTNIFPCITIYMNRVITFLKQFSIKIPIDIIVFIFFFFFLHGT
jgi:hypothetical protein